MNNFSLLLAVASLVTGIAFIYDFVKKRPLRKQNLQAALKLNPALTKKEIRQIKEGSGLLYQLAALFPIFIFVFLFRAFIYEPFRIPSGSMEPTLYAGDFIAVEKWAYGIKNPLTNENWIETGSPDYGDVVVFKYPEDPSVDFIKRVVGLPGDEIIYTADKRIYLRKACKAGEACENPQPVPLEALGKIEVPIQGLDAHVDYLLFNETLGSVKHQIQIDPRIKDLSHYYYRQRGQVLGSWTVPEDHYFMMGDNRDNSKDSRFWGFVPKEYLVGKTVCIWLSLDFERDESSWLPSFIPSRIRTERIHGID